MITRMFRLLVLVTTVTCHWATSASALTVETNFPGASVRVEGIDSERQVIAFGPARHRGKGWACWWHFRLTGIKVGQPLILNLVSPSAFGRPTRAMFSHDGKTWRYTEPGRRLGSRQVYQHLPERETIHFAWGPPFQLSHANTIVKQVTERDPAAKAFELCVSKDGHSVPALRWDLPRAKHGIWIEARQHAWESGSSWVCQGFLNWLSSDDPQARQLKQDARIVVVPIMDVDNVERGAGGKDQFPRDHNRDWADKPVWPEVAAAQKHILAMNDAGAFDLFLDLHNPGPGDKTPFFYAPAKSLLPPERAANQKRFHELAMKELGAEPLGFSSRVRTSGPGYHPLWKQISKNWVATHTAKHTVALTLETSWNTTNSTPAGYQSFGRALGRTITRYFQNP